MFNRTPRIVLTTLVAIALLAFAFSVLCFKVNSTGEGEMELNSVLIRAKKEIDLARIFCDSFNHRRSYISHFKSNDGTTNLICEALHKNFYVTLSVPIVYSTSSTGEINVTANEECASITINEVVEINKLSMDRLSISYGRQWRYEKPNSAKSAMASGELMRQLDREARVSVANFYSIFKSDDP